VSDIQRAPTVLVVDDDEAIRVGVKACLDRQGYAVAMARTASEAKLLLEQQAISCLVLGINLSESSGIDVIPTLVESDPSVAIVIINGRPDAQSAVLCMQGGVVDYLTKPFEPSALSYAVERAVRVREEKMATEETNRWLREEVAQFNVAIEHERLKLQRLAAAALQTLVHAMEANDAYLAGHSIRVADLGASLAAELGRSEEEVEQVRLAGRLHDIGMITISGRVLCKKGPLTKEEFEQVKQHTVVGFQILSTYPHLETVARFVRGHHERWDGTGYPDGLAARSIPWGGRVLAAAEVYDALTSTRPYRAKITPAEAKDQMRGLVMKVLDSEVFEALAAVVDRRHALEFVHEDRVSDSDRALALSHPSRDDHRT
jgi:putative two-component system response regulator